MACWNNPDTGSPRRRVARLSEIPLEARPLINLLVDQRLLSIAVETHTGDTTIEPAHEALLRQWGLLQEWLREDTGLLAVLDGIKRVSREWAANNKAQSWLAHVGSWPEGEVSARPLSRRLTGCKRTRCAQAETYCFWPMLSKKSAPL